MSKVNVIFNLKGKNTIIQCNPNDTMKEICLKFATKENIDINNIYFIYGGEKIKENMLFSEIINSEDKLRNEMNILVNNISDINENENNNQELYSKSKYIICPNCKGNCKIEIDHYKLSFYDCKQKCKKDSVSFNEYENSQKINESLIICDNCKKQNKNQTYNNEFFTCISCKINICPICKTSHDKSHNIINYEQKDFICYEHNKPFYSFCSDCKNDICMLCENKHLNHKIITYGKLIPEENNFKMKNDELKKVIDNFKNEINKIIVKLKSITNNIEIYLKLYNDFIHEINYNKINNNILSNINTFSEYNNKLIEDFNKINNSNSIIKKFILIIAFDNNLKEDSILSTIKKCSETAKVIIDNINKYKESSKNNSDISLIEIEKKIQNSEYLISSLENIKIYLDLVDNYNEKRSQRSLTGEILKLFEDLKLSIITLKTQKKEDENKLSKNNEEKIIGDLNEKTEKVENIEKAEKAYKDENVEKNIKEQKSYKNKNEKDVKKDNNKSKKVKQCQHQ